jgi:hypothetical protein
LVYKQNLGLQGAVEILRVAFTKRLLRSSRTIRPLIIRVVELEQANCLVNAGLI